MTPSPQYALNSFGQRPAGQQRPQDLLTQQFTQAGQGLGGLAAASLFKKKKQQQAQAGQADEASGSAPDYGDNEPGE